MRFGLNDEQQQLREAVAGFAAERAGSAEVRRHAVPGADYDARLWQAMAEELGLTGLIVPEHLGGAGAGAVELGVVLEALGESLVPSPFFATVALGATALLASEDTDAQARYLPGIAAGHTTATLCHSEGPHRETVATTATRTASGWTLSGTKRYVVDGSTADIVIVSAHDGAGTALFVVEGADGVRRTPSVPLDRTRPVATIELSDAPARRLHATADVVDSTLRRVAVALAAESVGVAQWCLDTTIAYAGSRVQFDRPIGSFQAIKHRAADMKMDVETTRAVVGYATWVADTDPVELAAVADLTAAQASDAVFRVAAQTLQILGGIGYTWEHDAHFYFKRAKASGLLFGSASEHREAALGALGV